MESIGGWLHIAVTIGTERRGWLVEAPIDPLAGKYCSYECVSLRARQVELLRQHGIHAPAIGGNVRLLDRVPQAVADATS